MKQYISFGPEAGLANRIKKIFSALRFNVDWNEPLELYWNVVGLVDKGFYELFSFDLFPFQEIQCEKKVILPDEFDVATDLGWRLKIFQGEVPEGFTQAFPKDKEEEEYIDFEYERIPQNVREIYLKYFGALKPSKQVEARINEIELPEDCIAVQVRLNKQWKEYNRGTDEDLNRYFDKMKKYPEDTKFYLACCDKEVAEQFKKEFSGRILELPEKDYEGNIDAVAELYLLSKPKELIGSYGSTFSELAWWLSGCRQKVTIIGRYKDWKNKGCKSILCPVCRNEAGLVYIYTKEECIRSYQWLYEEVPEDLDVRDTQLYQCKECDLVFANPMVGGSQKFYTWVTGHKNYYPTKLTPRWEWREIKRFIEKKHIKSVLEVGCGTGEFLEYIKEGNEELDCVGLDTTTSSYNECKKKNLKAYNESLDEYLKKHPQRFELVVAFHCLEHVETPLELTKQMLSALDTDGICMLSFPYSDVRIEKASKTANNMPPHHLTRWNINACKELATQVDAELEIVAPLAQTAFGDIVNSLKNTYFPIYSGGKISKMKVFLRSVRHLKRTWQIIMVGLTKDKILLAEHLGGEQRRRRVPWFVLIALTKHE